MALSIGHIWDHRVSAADEPRLPAGLLAASLITVAGASVMIASFQYVVVEMQVAFEFSSDSANALTFMPMAASLLVVFLAGSLADRWGRRPVLIGAISSFTLGAVLVPRPRTSGLSSSGGCWTVSVE
jgi:MFS family permease